VTPPLASATLTTSLPPVQKQKSELLKSLDAVTPVAKKAIENLINSLAPDAASGVGIVPTSPSLPPLPTDPDVAKEVLDWIHSQFGPAGFFGSELEFVANKLLKENLITIGGKLFYGGRLRSVHRGSRGGKYVVVSGKKVYL